MQEKSLLNLKDIKVEYSPFYKSELGEISEQIKSFIADIIVRNKERIEEEVYRMMVDRAFEYNDRHIALILWKPKVEVGKYEAKKIEIITKKGWSSVDVDFNGIKSTFWVVFGLPNGVDIEVKIVPQKELYDLSKQEYVEFMGFYEEIMKEVDLERKNKKIQELEERIKKLEEEKRELEERLAECEAKISEDEEEDC